MKRTLILASTCLALASGAQATGWHTCDSGERDGWQSVETLETKLADEGWKIRKIKEDGGCYEVYGRNAEGQRGEAYFHPVTLELELIMRRGTVLYRKPAEQSAD